MATNVQDLPPNLGKADSDGINDAYEALVHDKRSAGELAALLRRDPRGTIRRVVRMSATQRQTLNSMSADGLKTLVAPVLKALGSPDPTRVGFRLGIEERPLAAGPKTGGTPTGPKGKTTIIIEKDKAKDKSS